MGHALELAEFARRQEGKGIFDIGGAAGIVRQLVLRMLAELQPVACQAELRVPEESRVAPVLIPLGRLAWMAEELDLHLLELARAKCEIPRRDLVAKALAHLSDAERHADATRIEHVFEVHEDALGGLG